LFQVLLFSELFFSPFFFFTSPNLKK
jgi:hypothetical protein